MGKEQYNPHDQLPTIEEAKTNNLAAEASINHVRRSLFYFKVISGLLLLTTVILSIAVGILANRGASRGGGIMSASRMESSIRDAAVERGIVATSSHYQIDPLSVQQRALKMTMKEEYLTEELVIQRYALWCFYFATEHVLTSVTNGVFGYGTVPHWKDGWTNDGPDPCLWHGVRCKSGGVVVELNLSWSQITGVLPEELKLLNSLEKLNLRGNPGLGEGGVPTWLKDMTSLTFIDLRECSFPGDMRTELCDSADFLYADCSICSCCNLCSP